MVAPTSTKTRPRAKSPTAISVKTIAICVLFGVSCFYAGVLVGSNMGNGDGSGGGSGGGGGGGLRQLVNDDNNRFPIGVSAFAAGMSLLPREQFAAKFDMGVPLEKPGHHNEQVMLIYAHDEALPSNGGSQAKGNSKIPILEDVDAATENCDSVNVILAQPGDTRQCYAIMGQFRSYHIHKFLRLPEAEGEPLDRKAPLRLVSRGAQASGRISNNIPTKEETQKYWHFLKKYLYSLDSVLADIKPLAEMVEKDNTVIIMVCNHGQSELLMNFVCASKARGVDVSSLLVFATDKETQELAEGLGLVSFYDETNYADIPKEAAHRYADDTFSAIMMAKVYCVQQMVLLGYDVLFLDVDIVPYKPPLDFFHDKSLKHYDMYFQDDGSRGLFYAPYSANTGMYYVRNSDSTQHFFNNLLLAGDIIMATRSHQIALVSLLSEHASIYGLKVKILPREGPEFPGGYSFHNRHQFMKDLMEGKEDPYLFHMSWTSNKENKQKFFKQTGNWYLNDVCIESTANKILTGSEKEADKGSIVSGSLVEPCCRAEPMVECFYKDKPSKIHCPDSPTLDKNGKSFW